MAPALPSPSLPSPSFAARPVWEGRSLTDAESSPQSRRQVCPCISVFIKILSCACARFYYTLLHVEKRVDCWGSGAVYCRRCVLWVWYTLPPRVSSAFVTLYSFSRLNMESLSRSLGTAVDSDERTAPCKNLSWASRISVQLHPS